ncbi:sulfite exporter TauE/SafE family protein [Thalassotalea psychrophila]|uniref:Probable membrane transporter protein n=1 Tax=Thalassotalea psychrophila TaxID=3065647 RepID=A0ABY9TRG0_9GAMM|nr:sulfite exporter TauE/SafE family protein [Colwelliaceae bacterium SQ149]
MMANEVSLFIIAIFTSTLAGICAMGGGMILVLILPFFVPATAIIPIHGITQFASNSSRLAFCFKHVYWPFVGQFIIGALVGTALFSTFLINISSQNLPLFISVYLLLTLWLKPIERLFSKFESFYIVGAIQAGLGLLVGAPGPITVTLLYKKLTEKEQIIATASLLMGITNLNKVLVYSVIGFQFLEYWQLILASVVGATFGSILGNYLRNKIPNQHFMVLLKFILTSLALCTCVRTLQLPHTLN